MMEIWFHIPLLGWIPVSRETAARIIKYYPGSLDGLQARFRGLNVKEAL